MTADATRANRPATGENPWGLLSDGRAVVTGVVSKEVNKGTS